MVDIPGNSSTTRTIMVGETIADALEIAGDRDWFRIGLNAGQEITVLIDGLTLDDSYVRIRDAQGNLLFENDDIVSGSQRDARVSFKAETSGIYYIDVGSYEDKGTGTYQVSVTPYVAPRIGTVAELAYQLTHSYWGDRQAHFNVREGGSISVNLTALTPAGQTLARDALAAWTEIVGINFPEVLSGGQIVFDDNEEGAFANSTRSGGYITSAKVNVSVDWITRHGNGANSYSFQTYLHEIGHALGLGHQGNYNDSARYPYEASFRNDAWPMSVMSYFDQRENDYFAGQGFARNYVTTPMMVDIYAIGQLYGLSTRTRAGDTVYGPGWSSNSGTFAIYDSGGNDTIDISGLGTSGRINLEPGSFSNLFGEVGMVSIPLEVTIENAIGGSGDDELIGNAAANRLNGGGGNDRLTVVGHGDVIDGGDGADTLVMAASLGRMVPLAIRGGFAFAETGGATIVRAVETFRFGSDPEQSASQLATPATLGSLRYIASHGDLIRSFGTDALAGGQHFLDFGLSEKRQIHFEPLSYVAANGDLIRAFGANALAAANHYIRWGYTEGRATLFDALSYVASHADLRAAMGVNSQAATDHYIRYGFGEGRSISFDGLSYIASYTDLIVSMGPSAQNGAQHYITHGAAEGRAITFNPLVYIASHQDLISALGANATAGANHFISFGAREGRGITFNADGYMARYRDALDPSIDTPSEAAAHYITIGRSLGYSPTDYSTQVSDKGLEPASGRAMAETLTGMTAQNPLDDIFSGQRVVASWQPSFDDGKDLETPPQRAQLGDMSSLILWDSAPLTNG